MTSVPIDSLPLAAVERYLDDRGPGLCLLGPAPARRRLAQLAEARAGARGLVVVTRQLSDCDERQLAAGVYADCADLVGGLGLRRTAAYFAAEMLAVPAGRRTLGTVSYEARLALAALGVHDCWTDAQGLAASLQVVDALAQSSGLAALLVYGEAQRLRDRPGDQPLSALLDGLRPVAAGPGLKVVLTASLSSGRRLAQAAGDHPLIFRDLQA